LAEAFPEYPPHYVELAARAVVAATWQRQALGLEELGNNRAAVAVEAVVLET
jgi:hypothetical protein